MIFAFFPLWDMVLFFKARNWLTSAIRVGGVKGAKKKPFLYFFGFRQHKVKWEMRVGKKKKKETQIPRCWPCAKKGFLGLFFADLRSILARHFYARQPFHTIWRRFFCCISKLISPSKRSAWETPKGRNLEDIATEPAKLRKMPQGSKHFFQFWFFWKMKKIANFQFKWGDFSFTVILENVFLRLTREKNIFCLSASFFRLIFFTCAFLCALENHTWLASPTHVYDSGGASNYYLAYAKNS